MTEDGPGGEEELPDILYRCKQCMYVYPLQQTPRKDGRLACAHCGEPFELDAETLAELAAGD